MPFRDMILNVPAIAQGNGVCVTKPPLTLGPATADRAEWRSTAGCCSQSRSPGISDGESRDTAASRAHQTALERKRALPSPLLSESGISCQL